MNRRFVLTALALISATLVMSTTAGAVPARSVHGTSTKPQAPSYTIIDLGTLGGTTSNAYGINDSGMVVGSSTLPGDAATHAFAYSGGAMIDLGTLPGGTNSTAYAVNRYGQIAGTSEKAITEWPRCLEDLIVTCFSTTTSSAFRYAAGTMVELGGGRGLRFTPPFSFGYAINDHGDVAGVYDANAAGDRQAAYWQGLDRVTLPIWGTPTGINNDRQVISNGWPNSPVLWDSGEVTYMPTSPGPIRFGQWPSINNRGHVAYEGWIGEYPNVQRRALLYSEGGVKDMGPFNPNGISQHDQVVGSGLAADGSTEHAVSSRNGKMVDLNNLIPPGSGWVLHIARGVNKKGQIVGTGAIGGQERAYLLTPSHGR